jgi:hypothetical protein
MFKEFYRRKIEDKLEETNLIRFIELAKQYDKIFSDNDTSYDGQLSSSPFQHDILNEDSIRMFFPSVEAYDYNKNPVFIGVSGHVGVYACFYKNLMLVFNIDPDEKSKVVTIYMKTPDEDWKFPVSHDGYGERHVMVLSPTNVHAKVYVGYTVKVLGIYDDTHEHYTSGSWNKEFYHTMKELVDKVEGYTEYSALERAY